jgi:large subunit ribosomal protein L13
VNTLSFKTHFVTKAEVTRQWHIVDANGLTLGRISSRIAHVLRGKHKPEYTPNADCGDYVIIINADKIKLTGNKVNDKIYLDFSGYTGGQRQTTAKMMLAKKPEAVLERAIKGMLPKTKLGRQMYKKLFVYADASHPHAAQKPKEFNF